MVDVDRIGDLRTQLQRADVAYDVLRDGVQGTPCIRSAGHIGVPDVRLRPFVAYWADVPPKRIDTAEGGARIEPATPLARELSSRSLPRPEAGKKAGWIVRCAGQ
jgi:hypothetical protein